MTIAMMASGVACFVASLALVGVIWLGHWTPAQEHLRVAILGGALAGFLLGAIFVQISMAVGGPLGRVKFAASRDGGVSIEASDDECERPAATVTTTVEVPSGGGTVV